MSSIKNNFSVSVDPKFSITFRNPAVIVSYLNKFGKCAITMGSKKEE